MKDSFECEDDRPYGIARAGIVGSVSIRARKGVSTDPSRCRRKFCPGQSLPTSTASRIASQVHLHRPTITFPFSHTLLRTSHPFCDVVVSTQRRPQASSTKLCASFLQYVHIPFAPPHELTEPHNPSWQRSQNTAQRILL